MNQGRKEGLLHSKMNGFCLKRDQGLKAMEAHLYPNFSWVLAQSEIHYLCPDYTKKAKIELWNHINTCKTDSTFEYLHLIILLILQGVSGFKCVIFIYNNIFTFCTPGGYFGFQVKGMIEGFFGSLKFLISWVFWVGKFGKYFFGWFDLSRDLFGHSKQSEDLC